MFVTRGARSFNSDSFNSKPRKKAYGNAVRVTESEGKRRPSRRDACGNLLFAIVPNRNRFSSAFCDWVPSRRNARSPSSIVAHQALPTHFTRGQVSSSNQSTYPTSLAASSTRDQGIGFRVWGLGGADSCPDQSMYPSSLAASSIRLESSWNSNS